MGVSGVSGVLGFCLKKCHHFPNIQSKAEPWAQRLLFLGGEGPVHRGRPGGDVLASSALILVDVGRGAKKNKF